MSTLFNVQDIADFFLWKAKEEDQELLSNMKLQKLLYYAQGLHLALKNAPLFQSRIEAWTYGPVVPEVYHVHKHHEAGGIPANPNFDPASIDDDTKDFLDEIYEVFGQFSAIRLMELAHSDQCWKDSETGCEITQDSMKESLKEYIKNG
jgi:uncharacterized phage-associated protein